MSWIQFLRTSQSRRCRARRTVQPKTVKPAVEQLEDRLVPTTTPTVTWAGPAAITYGTPVGATQLDATASVPGTFAYTPAAGTVLGTGLQTLGVTFTPTDTADFTTVSDSVKLAVDPATPTNLVATPGNAAVSLSWTASAGASAYALYRGTSSGGETEIAYGITGISFTDTGVNDNLGSRQALSNGTTYYYEVRAVSANETQSGLSSQVAATPEKAPAAPTGLTASAGNAQVSLSWAPSAGATSYDIYRGTSSGGETLLASGVATTSYTSSGLTNGTTYYYEVSAVNAGGQSALSSQVSATPQAATPTLTWATPAALTYGTALSAAQLDATASVPGSFVYAPAAGTVLGAGTQTLTVTFTPTDMTDYTTASKSVTLTVNKATPTVTWATPAAITYGTALSATQLDATASVPGSFVYTPALGTVLTAGTQTLNVTFTPTDTTDYTTASKSVTLTVNAATPGTWTPLANPLNAVGTAILLTNGSVLVGLNDTTTWYKFTPDSTGSYVNGTWTTVASSHYSRLYATSVVLPDGRVFVAGGEYGSGPDNAEIYDPVANTWTVTAPPPIAHIDDSTGMLLPNGRVLVFGTGSQGAIYDPATNTWSLTGPKVNSDSNDEETVLLLPDGNLLTVDLSDGSNPNNAQQYIPALNTWIIAGTVPQFMTGPGTEFGPGLLLPDGRAFFVGGNGTTAYYTPGATVTDPGSWVVGPSLPNGLFAADAPAAVMANGHVLIEGSTSYGGPTTFFDFNPATEIYVALSPPNANSGTTGPYMDRMLALPNGQILFGNSQYATFSVYTPSGPLLTSSQPVVTSVSANGDGTFRVTGTLLNSFTTGASYGDDAQMSSNYPLVQLTNTSGQVFYARTFNFGSGVGTGAGTTATDFSLPVGLPAGTYNLSVVANGLASTPMAFTVPTPSSAPAAPTGLMATAGNGEVSLTWTAVAGVAGYDIFRGTSSGTEIQLATGVAGTSFADFGVSNGTTYYYKVAASNTGGQGSKSNEASAMPQGAIPAVPTGLTASAGNAQVSLSWRASPGATSYNLYRSTSSGGETLLQSGISGTSFSDTAGLTNGTIYYYEVSAVDGSGQSARSGEVSAIPEPTLAVPTGLTATDTAGPVNLTWNVTAGAADYYVYRGTSSGGEVLLEVVSSSSFTDSRVVTGHTYFYQVSAYNGVESARSGEVSATIPTIAVPAAPTNVVATGGNRQVTLTWTASVGAASYYILRGTSSGNETTAIAAGIKGTSYIDSSLTNGTTYYYEVVAVNFGGGSPPSMEVYAAPTAAVPAAPAALAASASNAQVVVSLTGKPTTGPTVTAPATALITGKPAAGIHGSAVTGTTANLSLAGSDLAGAASRDGQAGFTCEPLSRNGHAPQSSYLADSLATLDLFDFVDGLDTGYFSAK